MAYLNDPYNINKESTDSGHPKGKPEYQADEPRTLKPSDHFKLESDLVKTGEKHKYLIDKASRHFTRDINDPELIDIPVTYTDEATGEEYAVFSGSTTNVNPFKDKDKQKILDTELEVYETDKLNTKEPIEPGISRVPPISPLHPFTRMDPKIAQISNLTTYNRAKLPVADLEFRKAFRHIFITRPECYIMARNPDGPAPILSEQAESDEDFASCWSRMPHILKLLSPIYITGSFSKNGVNSNWNYLLSNRVMGLTVSESTLSINEEISKSVEGFTVTPPRHFEALQGSTLSLKFQDTKNMEIYEMIRMWMLYMYKRHKGVFAPPYNGYQYKNAFMDVQEGGTPVNNSIIYHPYDRAEEYCASLFDIVTNESMTKILYWCKYYGIYPTSVNMEGLSNDKNSPITSATITSNFKYHYKLENVNKTLVEFNYAAGITDDLGRVNKAVEASYPFLLSDNYVGSAGMFTGSPYIILGESQNDPLNPDNRIVTPYLQFMPLEDGTFNNKLNLNIVNKRKENGGIIGIK